VTESGDNLTFFQILPSFKIQNRPIHQAIRLRLIVGDSNFYREMELLPVCSHSDHL